MLFSAYSDWISPHVLLLRHPVAMWSCYISTQSALTVPNSFVSLTGSVTWAFSHFLCQSWILWTQHITQGPASSLHWLWKLIMYLHQVSSSSWVVRCLSNKSCERSFKFPLFSFLKTLEASHLLLAMLTVSEAFSLSLIMHILFLWWTLLLKTLSSRKPQKLFWWHKQQSPCVACQKSKEQEEI